MQLIRNANCGIPTKAVILSVHIAVVHIGIPIKAVKITESIKTLK